MLLVTHLDGPAEALVHMPRHAQSIAVAKSHFRAQQVLVELVGKELNLFVVVVDLRLQWK